MSPARFTAIFFAFLATQLGFAAQTKTACPDASRFETIDDCPWASIAKMAEAPNTTLRQFLSSDIDSMLIKDSQSHFFKSLWGTSINFDEGEKKIIVPSKTVQELNKIFSVNPAWNEESRLMHAGVQHTYGYLFSNLYTSYGYKRARWVKNELENGFGISPDLLGPKTKEGTFFSNITYFLGSICFRNNPQALNKLKGHPEAANVSEKLKNFPYSKLKITRLEETVLWEANTVVLRTDIVKFFNSPSDLKSNSALLIYSILDSREDGPKIISGFPVNSSFADRLFQEKNLGENQMITTRYNAWVNGITGANPPKKGLRLKAN